MYVYINQDPPISQTDSISQTDPTSQTDPRRSMPPPPQLPHPPHTNKSEWRNRDEEVVHVIEDADAAASSVEHGSKWRRLTLSGDKHDPRSVFKITWPH